MEFAWFANAFKQLICAKVFMQGKNILTENIETHRPLFISPPPKVRGDIFGFSAIPVRDGVGVGVTDLYPRYLLNQLMEFH